MGEYQTNKTNKQISAALDGGLDVPKIKEDLEELLLNIKDIEKGMYVEETIEEEITNAIDSFGYISKGNTDIWGTTNQYYKNKMYPIKKGCDLVLDFSKVEIYTTVGCLAFFETSSPANGAKSLLVIDKTELRGGAASGNGVKFIVKASRIPANANYACVYLGEGTQSFDLFKAYNSFVDILNINTLKEKVKEVENKTKNIEKEIHVEETIEEEITNAIDSFGYISKDNTDIWGPTNQNYKNKMYPIKKGCDLVLDFSKVEIYTTVGCLAFFETSSPANGAKSLLVIDKTELRGGAASGNGVKFIVKASRIPANANYACVYLGEGTQSFDLFKAYNTIVHVSGFNSLKEKVKEVENRLTDIDERIIKEKIITAVGSSGLDESAGGQYDITESQKKQYGVTTIQYQQGGGVYGGLTIAKALQVLLGYDETNILAFSGNTASTIFFRSALMPLILKKSVTLKADKSSVSYIWSTDTIASSMTSALNNIPYQIIGDINCLIHGIKVKVNPSAGTITVIDDIDKDVRVREGSLMYAIQTPKSDQHAAIVRHDIENTTGLILQVGANSEGASADEIVNYCELAIKRSNCKWFVILAQSADDVSDLNKAKGNLKAKFGSNFIDHMDYLKSVEALRGQGLTPTTSDEYPDENGVNSNPLTNLQIEHGIPCDMECIATDRVPSSFWMGAYRDGQLQQRNEGHLNAQGLECTAKYIFKMITLTNIVKQK